MKRRSLFKSLVTAPGLAGFGVTLAAQSKPAPIQLHTDIHVKAEEEKQLIDDFHKLYLPRIRKAQGFIGAKLLKFKQSNIGTAPDHINYRLIQVFETEALREQWSVHPDHKVAWHQAIESHLKVPFTAWVFEIAAESKPTR